MNEPTKRLIQAVQFVIGWRGRFKGLGCYRIGWGLWAVALYPVVPPRRAWRVRQSGHPDSHPHGGSRAWNPNP